MSSGFRARPPCPPFYSVTSVAKFFLGTGHEILSCDIGKNRVKLETERARCNMLQNARNWRGLSPGDTIWQLTRNDCTTKGDTHHGRGVSLTILFPVIVSVRRRW